MTEGSSNELEQHDAAQADPGRDQELDPAQRSLADALRVSFGILAAAMAVLVVWYLLSNVFSVSEQEVAVKLRFGRIVGHERAEAVIEPGGPYFAWPYPVEDIVRVPTAPKQIAINRAFWPDRVGQTGQTRAEAQGGPLNPAKDGAVLTGDGNIIHLQATAVYQVKHPVPYLENVRGPDAAEKLVRAVVERGLVHAAARSDIDDLYAARFDRQGARSRINRVLEEAGAGVRVTSLSLDQTQMPVAVQNAFRAVVDAEQEASQQIEAARQERSEILNETAGKAHEALTKLLRRYERAIRIEREAAEAGEGVAEARTARRAAGDRIRAAFDDLSVEAPEGEGERLISGSAAELINKARTYATEVVQRVRGEADRFRSLLPQYRATPRIVVNRLWRDALENVLTGEVESLYIPEGRPYLRVNRDPAVRRKQEKERLEAQQQRLREQGRAEP